MDLGITNVNVELDRVSGFHTVFTGSPRGHHRWEVRDRERPIRSAVEQPSLSPC